MQPKVNTSLWCSLSEKGFSLDELVLKLKELFSSKGFSEILELLLDLVQESGFGKCLFFEGGKN